MQVSPQYTSFSRPETKLSDFTMPRSPKKEKNTLMVKTPSIQDIKTEIAKISTMANPATPKKEKKDKKPLIVHTPSIADIQTEIAKMKRMSLKVKAPKMSGVSFQVTDLYAKTIKHGTNKVT